MIISPEYAEELGRQIDELEAENERLREFSTCARLPAATVDAIKAAIREHFKSIGTSSVASSGGIERVYYSGFSLDKLADAVAAGLAAQPPAAPVETGRQVSCAVGGKPYADSHECSSVPEPIAFVPVHPRNGPLWSDTYAAASFSERSPNYPRMALYAAQPPTAASREDALEAQGTIEQLEKQLAFERKKSEPNFLHAGSPLWRIDLLCEQHELYTKDELVGLIQKMVQEAGRPNV